MPGGIEGTRDVGYISVFLFLRSIQTEVDQLMMYKVFKNLPHGNHPPSEYQRIPYHFVFDVKFDLRHL